MEQGLGDALHFARYVPLVKARGGQVALECREPLLRLMGDFACVDQLVPERGALPPFDVHAALMSLPCLFKTTLESIPGQVPYLYAEPQLLNKWKGVLAEVPEFKVGIAWQGNPHHKWDRHRSLSISSFEPLARVLGVRLYSLQRGPGTEQLQLAPFAIERPIGLALSDRDAFAETAALMKNLDLIVTVDTATAHLAGALGVPVWVALSQACDWRWLLDREDSPWYPTMRLFRQPRLGEWGPVMQRIAGRLDRMLESRQ